MWSANLSVAPKALHESRAFTLSWAAGPSACSGWNGTDHIELHRHWSASPSSPDPSTRVTSTAGSSSGYDDLVHRSDKTFYYTVFACEDAECTDWYGHNAGSTTGSTASSTTEKELWELEGVSSESDVSSCVVDNAVANAPHVFFYPTAWPGTAYDGKLAMYYSTWGDTTTPSEIYYRLHNAAGWPSDGFNNSASWSSAVLVAEGSTSHADDDFAIDHPWSMLTYDGTNYRVQLFAHTQHQSTSYHEKIVQIESTTAVGDNFGLGCSGNSCSTTPLNGAGYLAIDADGTSTTDYVENARHSRIAWDYVYDPIIDAGTDAPTMLIQVEGPLGCMNVYDDIGQSTGTWSSGAWSWATANASGCPTVEIADGHDSANIPLPDTELKVYYKDYATDEWNVIYWSGGVWEDGTTIEFVWDSSGSGPDHVCIENVSTVVHVNSGTVNAGMFFMLMDSASCNGVGFDDDPNVNDSAIVFARLAN